MPRLWLAVGTAGCLHRHDMATYEGYLLSDGIAGTGFVSVNHIDCTNVVSKLRLLPVPIPH